jgi:hypothetical protein
VDLVAVVDEEAEFGDSLRSNTDTSMVNGALCKLLCHNVCCLIPSRYERGIEATFWGNEATVADLSRSANPCAGAPCGTSVDQRPLIRGADR